MRLLQIIAITLPLISFGQHPKSVELLNRPITDKEVLAELKAKEEQGGPFTNINSVKFSNNDGISFGLGRRNNDRPTVVYGSFVVVGSDHKAFMIDLMFAEVFKIKNSKAFYVGGVFDFRGVGSYYLYKIENDECKLIFHSDEHVYNVKTTSCENFKNGKLNLVFKDINNDDYPDLNFSGTREIYCFYPEDRSDDNKILKEERVNIKYLFDRQTGKFVKAN